MVTSVGPWREVSIMARLRHPNIVLLLGAVRSPPVGPDTGPTVQLNLRYHFLRSFVTETSGRISD